MRSRNHNNVGFAASVQQYFVEKTGRCLVLSSRDTELVLGWEKTGASVATITAGIDQAINVANRPPRDLFACKKYVEHRISKSITSSSTRSVEPTPVETMQPEPDRNLLKIAIHKLRRAHERTDHVVLREAYTHAIQFCENANDENVVHNLDQTLITDIVASLPQNDVEEVNQRVQQQYGAQLAKMSPTAAETTFAARRNDLLRQEMGIVTLFE